MIGILHDNLQIHIHNRVYQLKVSNGYQDLGSKHHAHFHSSILDDLHHYLLLHLKYSRMVLLQSSNQCRQFRQHSNLIQCSTPQGILHQLEIHFPHPKVHHHQDIAHCNKSRIHHSTIHSILILHRLQQRNYHHYQGGYQYDNLSINDSRNSLFPKYNYLNRHLYILHGLVSICHYNPYCKFLPIH